MSIETQHFSADRQSNPFQIHQAEVREQQAQIDATLRIIEEAMARLKPHLSSIARH